MGAPVVDHEEKEDIVATSKPNEVNNFTYGNDKEGKKCPFSAHLRKMNLRASQIPGIDAVQSKRIMRQGITYGPEVTLRRISTANPPPWPKEVFFL